ncbi:UvrD-helicase domain-containing protein [bacterium]|nr:UvrD-helicase domain-containing protein [bacterium]
MANGTHTDQLNPAQIEAVNHTEGPLLIFAGAGTGKTRVITHRIARLIFEIGIPPEHILAVTFTNKAAGEMRDRLGRMCGEAAANNVFFGTFHRFCAWILRRHGEAVGVKRHFTIYDQADSLHLVRQILKSMDRAQELYRPAAILSVIDRAKNGRRGPADVAAGADGPVEEMAAKIYVEYDRRLRESDALDFTDILVYAVKILETSAQVLRSLQERFQYIHVDEYQDTNAVQYALLKFLAAEHRNLCVVGDDDQAIYSWRGATIRNILSFKKDFPGAREIFLQENYRSTQGILDLAYSIIRHNRERADKRLVTEKGPGHAPLVFAAADGYDEAAFISRRILENLAETPYSEMAVFFRMAAQSRLIEEEFLARGIPYVVVSGVGFYERREVKDLLAYLRVIANPADDAAFLRILNVPKRGIGETSVAALAEHAKTAGIPVSETLNRLDALPVSAALRRRLSELAELLAALRTEAARSTLEEVLRQIVARTDYFNFLEKSDPAGFEDRAANVQELYTVAQEFARRTPEADATVQMFIEEMSLLTDLDRMDPSADRVSLMTLHAAKGLEFSTVFMIGLEEGSLPHASSFESDAEMEEERRLCYVGITRAKSRLFLSHAFSRRIYGETRDDIRPSRFLDEAGLIDAGDISFIDTHGRGRRNVEDAKPDLIERVPLDEETAAFGVEPGGRVRHPLFGEGLLLRISGRGEDAMATVRFDRAGKKRLKLAYAKLSPA